MGSHARVTGVRDAKALQVDHEETGSPEDVDRRVTVSQTTCDEGDEGPDPRDAERDREVREKGPAHRDGLAEHGRVRFDDGARIPYARTRATTGIRFPRVGFRAGTFRSKYGLRPSRARARHHDGGRHPGHGLTRRFALLLRVTDRGQGAGPRLPLVDNRAVRGRLTAARATDRQVGERAAHPGRALGERARDLLLVDERAPQLALALPDGLRGPDLLEALRRPPGRTGPRDGAHGPVARALGSRRRSGVAVHGGPTGEGVFRIQRAVDAARHAQWTRRRIDWRGNLEGHRGDERARHGLVRLRRGDGREPSTPATL